MSPASVLGFTESRLQHIPLPLQWVWPPLTEFSLLRWLGAEGVGGHHEVRVASVLLQTAAGVQRYRQPVVSEGVVSEGVVSEGGRADEGVASEGAGEGVVEVEGVAGDWVEGVGTGHGSLQGGHRLVSALPPSVQ